MAYNHQKLKKAAVDEMIKLSSEIRMAISITCFVDHGQDIL